MEASDQRWSSSASTVRAVQIYSPPAVAPIPTMGSLYHVTVTVTWWSSQADPNASRAETGKLSVQLDQVVYLR